MYDMGGTKHVFINLNKVIQFRVLINRGKIIILIEAKIGTKRISITLFILIIFSSKLKAS